MFHLIGVAHCVQSKKKGEDLSADQEEFVKRLGDAIKAVKPALVAEEFSEHALQKLSKDKTQRVFQNGKNYPQAQNT